MGIHSVNGNVSSKILLVEDDHFISFLLKNRLQKEAGFEIVLARDGEEALNVLKSNQVDLLLLDIILPKKPGFELMEEIRDWPQLEKVPRIIISCLGQPEDIDRGLSLGAVEYFIKGETPIDDLVSRIKEVLYAQVYAQ